MPRLLDQNQIPKPSPATRRFLIKVRDGEKISRQTHQETIDEAYRNKWVLWTSGVGCGPGHYILSDKGRKALENS